MVHTVRGHMLQRRLQCRPVTLRGLAGISSAIHSITIHFPIGHGAMAAILLTTLIILTIRLVMDMVMDTGMLRLGITMVGTDTADQILMGRVIVIQTALELGEPIVLSREVPAHR